MAGGRKNLKRATEEKHVTLQDGQCIMQVVSLRGSNLIEVMDARGEKSLALFPAKFQKSIWIKRGNFVVVDESGKKEALESGSKVACIVIQVLIYAQVRALQKSAEWPEIFKHDSNERPIVQQENETDTSDDDGLPPLEANTNRIRPFQPNVDEDLESDQDNDDYFVGSSSSTNTM
ncbi:probable RNA-binding protein EIF1AD isoform X1 [Trifolium pratense]|uniref:probable RNA-binding protein EIF1AD isoform X1 n=2 Tax=Trifolium pratense TaxID=57577 RepID=UPI001E697632|nr:probable RNA-binding protein EIF1AD isoform X1 [Trifolium pratense]